MEPDRNREDERRRRRKREEKRRRREEERNNSRRHVSDRAPSASGAGAEAAADNPFSGMSAEEAARVSKAIVSVVTTSSRETVERVRAILHPMKTEKKAADVATAVVQNMIASFRLNSANTATVNPTSCRPATCPTPFHQPSGYDEYEFALPLPETDNTSAERIRRRRDDITDATPPRLLIDESDGGGVRRREWKPRPSSPPREAAAAAAATPGRHPGLPFVMWGKVKEEEASPEPGPSKAPTTTTDRRRRTLSPMSGSSSEEHN